MHVWARWQHQEVRQLSGPAMKPRYLLPGQRFIDPDGSITKVDFDEWDLFQIGGVIFF